MEKVGVYVCVVEREMLMPEAIPKLRWAKGNFGLYRLSHSHSDQKFCTPVLPKCRVRSDYGIEEKVGEKLVGLCKSQLI